METTNDKFDSSLIQRIINPQSMAEDAQPIVVNSGTVLEWLEEQAREGLRGRVNDKPRWTE